MSAKADKQSTLFLSLGQEMMRENLLASTHLPNLTESFAQTLSEGIQAGSKVGDLIHGRVSNLVGVLEQGVRIRDGDS